MAYFLIDRYHVSATGKTYYAVFDVTTLQSQWLCEEDLISFAKKSRVNGVSSDGTFTLTPLDKVADTAMAFASRLYRHSRFIKSRPYRRELPYF